ncbi:MAG: phosphoribosylformylglycinamidine synthase subunit PurQ [Deltaproteobacteria bacterium]|nr:phosphoribosylformylglycinamidine synthase subunit PurQ [Deltaproteobacteria bacterium]
MPCDLAAARSEVRVLVLTGLGLNCEQETAQGFRMCGAQADLVHLSDMLAGLSRPLEDYQVLAMIGGFAFGDHLGGGVVYANRLRYRMLDALLRFVSDGGLVLGICNGFQTMVKLGLLPGLAGDYGTQTATLAANDRLGYRNAWVTVRTEPSSPCVWTRDIDSMDLPARHGEGKFVTASEEILDQLREQHLVALRYVDPQGEPTQQWPANPNGSPDAIAGICDPTGRLFGLMPHPDAFLYGYNHPQWPRRKLATTLAERGDGLRIFQNGVDHAAEKLAGRTS